MEGVGRVVAALPACGGDAPGGQVVGGIERRARQAGMKDGVLGEAQLSGLGGELGIDQVGRLPADEVGGAI